MSCEKRPPDAHNPEVGGSNPPPLLIFSKKDWPKGESFFVARILATDARNMYKISGLMRITGTFCCDIPAGLTQSDTRNVRGRR